MNMVRLVTPVGSIVATIVLFACSSTPAAIKDAAVTKKPADAGTKTAPKATTPTTKKPPVTKPSAPKTVTPSDKSDGGMMACTEDDVGKCSCLSMDQWFETEEGTIYDMICCSQVGDTFDLYTCGNDFICDDSSGTATCEML